jgi:hypothetical protein
LGYILRIMGQGHGLHIGQRGGLKLKEALLLHESSQHPVFFCRELMIVWQSNLILIGREKARIKGRF